jgi:Fe-S-cluster containining protein
MDKQTDGGPAFPILPTITNCDNCGACCMHMRTPPHIVAMDDDGNWSNYGGQATKDFFRLVTAPPEAQQAIRDRLRTSYDDIPDESPCAWLDLETKQCRWHEHRPNVCRDFDIGGESCVATREAYEIADAMLAAREAKPTKQGD